VEAGSCRICWALQVYNECWPRVLFQEFNDADSLQRLCCRS
jgi:hypothetical protein